jgi:hypothetical protein
VQRQRAAAARAERRALAAAEGRPIDESEEQVALEREREQEELAMEEELEVEEGEFELGVGDMHDDLESLASRGVLSQAEISATSPAEARALSDYVLTRVDGPKLAQVYLQALLAAQQAGRVHIPAALATVYVDWIGMVTDGLTDGPPD